jgi:hypothetical protein
LRIEGKDILMKKKIIGYVIIAVLSAIVMFIQNGKIDSLQEVISGYKPDTVMIAGNTIYDVDTIVKVREVKVSPVIIRDTVYQTEAVLDTVYKRDTCAGTIQFHDTSNALVSLSGWARFPEGNTKLIYTPKVDIRGLINRSRVYYGGGYVKEFGAFVYINANYKKVQGGFMTGQHGFGLYIGKAL